jgi:hypothetical protein
MAIYQSDPEPEPDSAFAEGALDHLVPGSRGRLRDSRRTPLRVTRVMPQIGSFEVQIEAFEDRGARWQLPLGTVSHLQFPLTAARAPAGTVAELRAAAARFERPLTVAVDPGEAQRTVRAIEAEALALRQGALSDLPTVQVHEHIERREGHPALFALLARLLEERELTEIEDAFAHSFVSNPHAGEMVKGHAIVLAELGLCPYAGTIVRDPATFEEPWTRGRRAQHLIVRIAFTRALWSALGHDELTLYRGAASEAPLAPRPAASFVSATFSEAVAHEHYAGGPKTRVATLARQRVPVTRLLMTFLETAAFNERFHEAEAVLIGDPASLTF